MSEHDKVRAAAFLRMEPLDGLGQAIAEAEALFRDGADTVNIEELHRLRHRYGQAIENAHKLQGGPTYAVGEKVERLVRLDDRLGEAQGRLDNYIISVQQSVKRATEGEEDVFTKAAQELVEQERDTLIAAGRRDAYHDLRSILAEGRQRREKQVTHVDQPGHLVQRIARLESELPRLIDKYDALVGTVTKKGAAAEAKAFRDTIAAHAELAEHLRETAQGQQLETLVEQSTGLETRFEHLEHQAAALYGRARTHWKERVVKKVGKVAAYGVLAIASVKLSAIGYQFYNDWRSNNQQPVVAEVAAPQPIEQEVPQWQRTVSYVKERFNPDTILYVNRETNEATMVRFTGNEGNVLYTVPYTAGRVPGDKQLSGDNRTDQGVFAVDKRALSPDGRFFDTRFGSAIANFADIELLAGEAYAGQGIAGAATPAYQRAITEGKDVTNGSVIFPDAAARKVVTDLAGHALVIVEDPRKPLVKG